MKTQRIFGSLFLAISYALLSSSAFAEHSQFHNSGHNQQYVELYYHHDDHRDNGDYYHHDKYRDDGDDYNHRGHDHRRSDYYARDYNYWNGAYYYRNRYDYHRRYQHWGYKYPRGATFVCIDGTFNFDNVILRNTCRYNGGIQFFIR